MQLKVHALFSLMLLSQPLAAQQQGPSAPPRPTVAVMSDDATVIAAQHQHTLRVWRRDGTLLAKHRNLDAFRGAVTPKALAAVSGNRITIWRGKGYGKRVRLSGPKVLSMGRVKLSADGRVAAAAFAADGGVGDADKVAVWDATRGSKRTSIRITRGRVLGAELSPKGRWIAIYGDGQGGALLQVHRLDRGGASKPWLSWRSKKDITTYAARFLPGQPTLLLAAGERLLLFDLEKRQLRASQKTAQLAALFPPKLRGMIRRFPGAHQLAVNADGTELLTLHGYRVTGVARWSLPDLKPLAWVKRPARGGTMRQVAFDAKGGVWLLTSGYTETVTLQQPQGGRFKPVRSFRP